VSPERRAEFGWVRGLATALVILIVGFVAVVYVTNVIVTRFTGMQRPTRVGLATAWFFISLLALAFVLRRLQARGIV
jgi:hypothetical protein